MSDPAVWRFLLLRKEVALGLSIFYVLFSFLAGAARKTKREQKETLQALKVLIEAIEKEGSLQETISPAAMRMFKWESTSAVANQLFSELFEKGQGYEVAIQIAIDFLKSDNSVYLSEDRRAVELLRILIRKGQNQTAVTAFAKEGVHHQHPQVRSAALLCWIELLGKDGSIQLATEAAQEGIKDAHGDVRRSAQKLLTALSSRE